MDEKCEIIINICCEVCGITREQFFSKRRFEDIINARFLAMKAMYVFLRKTYTDIGKILRPEKPMDHSTIIHGVKTIDGYLLFKDEKVSPLYDIITARINREVIGRDEGVLMVFFPKNFDIHAVVREFNKKHHDLEFQFK